MVENKEYFKMLSRMVRTAGARVGNGDGEDLLHLRQLQIEVDNAMLNAVCGLRRQGHSFGYIAKSLGVTRQYVQQKWGM